FHSLPREEAARLTLLSARPGVPLVVHRAGRRAVGTGRPGGERRAYLLGDAPGPPRGVDERVARPGARPVPADAAAGDLTHPPPGGEALGQARPVLPQAALRSRGGVGAVTELLREIPAPPGVGGRFAERLV